MKNHDFFIAAAFLEEAPFDPEEDCRLPEAFKAVDEGGEAPAIIAYLEGRTLQRLGRHLEAACRFEEAFARARSSLRFTSLAGSPAA